MTLRIGADEFHTALPPCLFFFTAGAWRFFRHYKLLFPAANLLDSLPTHVASKTQEMHQNSQATL